MVSINPEFIGAYEARTRFAELLERAERGAEITITRNGKPVARLIPVQAETTPEQRRAAIERWKQRSQGLTLGGLKIRDLIDEGRR